MLLLPNYTKIKGKKIKAPVVRPSLTPIHQRGIAVGYVRKNLTPFGSIALNSGYNSPFNQRPGSAFVVTRSLDNLHKVETGNFAKVQPN